MAHASRVHRVFLGLLVLGFLLRALVQFTYWPAMWNPDSHNYFHAAESFWLDTTRPSGYGFFLRFVPGWESLWPVAVLQHVLALLLALGIYVVLQRWHVPRWAAAVATVPLLLDPMQVSIEQFMLSDFLTQLLVISACLALIWHHKIGLRQAAIAGTLLGLAATVRSIAVPAIAIACVWALLGARRRLVTSLVVALSASVPLGAYVVAYHHQHGVYATSSFGSHFLYLRVAVFAECEKLDLPVHERPLCPASVPPRLRTDSMLLWQPQAPPRLLRPPAGMTVESVLADFNRRVIAQQPIDYAREVTRDSLRAFYPTRRIWFDNHFDDQWLLESKFWYEDRSPESKRLLAGGVTPRLSTTGARVADAYPLYVPGPVSAVCLVIAGACVLGYRGARARPMVRLVVASLSAVSLSTLLVPAVTAMFSWRYQIIQIELLPVAAVLAVSAMRGHRGPSAATEPRHERADPLPSAGSASPIL